MGLIPISPPSSSTFTRPTPTFRLADRAGCAGSLAFAQESFCACPLG